MYYCINLKLWEDMYKSHIDMIDVHNFICIHIKQHKVGFWGKRKLKRAMKHIRNSMNRINEIQSMSDTWRKENV